MMHEDGRRLIAKKINIEYYKYEMLHTTLNDFFPADLTNYGL